MWRWTNWAARTLVTAVLLSFLSIWTTGYIVNSYMETLLKQLDLPLQTQPFALSGMWGKLWGADPAGGTREAASPVPTATQDTAAHPGASPSASTSASPSASPNASMSTSPSPSSSPSPSTSPSPSAGLSSDDPAAAQASPASPEPSGDAAVPVFNAGAGTVDMTDQQRDALKAAMSKLNAIQLAQLTGAVEDGLTQEEWTRLGESIKPSLSAAEYQQMMELLQSRVDAPTTANPPTATAPASDSHPAARQALP